MFFHLFADRSLDGSDAEVLLSRRSSRRRSRISALFDRVRQDPRAAIRSRDVGLHLPGVDQGDNYFQSFSGYLNIVLCLKVVNHIKQLQLYR